MEVNKILQGDCLETLKQIPDKSVNCCVTSPPYFGLRSYIDENSPDKSLEIGLEETPEQFVQKLVEVFREVRRVLKDDGTLWLNLGDSYASNTKGSGWPSKKQDSNYGSRYGARKFNHGLKEKDLIGIPWMVAKALQQPYYKGRIKDEKDRMWLAAMIDGEGCMFLHKRKAGQSNGQGYKRKSDTYGAGLEVANTHIEIINRCIEITGVGSICTVERESKLKKRNIPLHRWNVRSNECRWIIEEVYPYLVGKKHEARLLLGCPSSGDVASMAHEGLKMLHNGKIPDIDFPEPESLYEQGFWLRQDIIWSKNNPMPESVTDRCTKAHEYIFLLSKSKQYYYDNGAIMQDGIVTSAGSAQRDTSLTHGVGGNNSGINRAKEKLKIAIANGETIKANKRSVWTVNTKPYSGAHFATFPEDLIVDCIKAGCPEDGIVLDPFGGAGTTALVARKLNRNYILCELNPEYVGIAQKRINQTVGIFG